MRYVVTAHEQVIQFSSEKSYSSWYASTVDNVSSDFVGNNCTRASVANSADRKHKRIYRNTLSKEILIPFSPVEGQNKSIITQLFCQKTSSEIEVLKLYVVYLDKTVAYTCIFFLFFSLFCLFASCNLIMCYQFGEIHIYICAFSATLQHHAVSYRVCAKRGTIFPYWLPLTHKKSESVLQGVQYKGCTMGKACLPRQETPENELWLRHCIMQW